jgi:hypothetical protein
MGDSERFLIPDLGLLCLCFAKMKVHPEILMKTKDRENLHCEIGAKFGAEETTSHAEGLSEKTKRRTCTPPYQAI